jgi:hypothetical protein
MLNFNTIFNKIKVLLRIRKDGKATSVPMREVRLFWDFQLFNIADHNHRAKLVDVYYAFRRFFVYGWGNPRNACREVFWFFQRGRRGWAACDVWSLDDYLSGWLPDALRRLKMTKHGVPSSMFEPEDCDKYGNPSEAGWKAGEARWDATMDKMIAGFEADRRAQEGLYEGELGSYPLDRPSGVSADAWEKVRDDRFRASQALTERDLKLADEGLALFVKHYRNLWD